jgi:hypothetical protein
LVHFIPDTKRTWLVKTLDDFLIRFLLLNGWIATIALVYSGWFLNKYQQADHLLAQM